MQTDSIFQQGATHEVCEDYALNGGGYAIVSDGCSSGQFTDWGSRLLCKAAEQNLAKQRQHPMQFYQAVGATVLTQARTFALPPSCLTATLLTAQVTDDVIRTLAMGDGVIGGKRKDGRWKIHVIDFPTPLGAGGAPYYLKYDIYHETEQWMENCGSNFTITTYFGNIMCPEMEYPVLEGDPGTWPNYNSRSVAWAQHVTETIQEKEFDKEHPYNEFNFPVEEYEFVFVASDGMESFTERRVTKTTKYNEDISVLDALRVLMDIRSHPQGFMRLQRDWSFKQERAGTFKRRQWSNGDDVGVGVLYCGKD